MEPATLKLLPAWPTAADAYPTRFANFGADGGGVPGDNGIVRSTHIFYASAPPRPGQEDVHFTDPLFPTALRITVDVYDRAGRLERPVRHVMTIPVGGG